MSENLLENLERAGRVPSKEKFRRMACSTFIYTGACPYNDRCVFLHDYRIKTEGLKVRSTKSRQVPNTSASSKEKDTFYWPDMNPREVHKKLDFNGLPDTNQAYTIPESFAFSTADVHDRAVYSIWSHFTAFCQHTDNNYGSVRGAICSLNRDPYFTDANYTKNLHVPCIDRLPIFVNLSNGDKIDDTETILSRPDLPPSQSITNYNSMNTPQRTRSGSTGTGNANNNTNDATTFGRPFRTESSGNNSRNHSGGINTVSMNVNDNRAAASATNRAISDTIASNARHNDHHRSKPLSESQQYTTTQPATAEHYGQNSRLSRNYLENGSDLGYEEFPPPAPHIPGMRLDPYFAQVDHHQQSEHQHQQNLYQQHEFLRQQQHQQQQQQQQLAELYYVSQQHQYAEFQQHIQHQHAAEVQRENFHRATAPGIPPTMMVNQSGEYASMMPANVPYSEDYGVRMLQQKNVFNNYSIDNGCENSTDDYYETEHDYNFRWISPESGSNSNQTTPGQPFGLLTFSPEGNNKYDNFLSRPEIRRNSDSCDIETGSGNVEIDEGYEVMLPSDAATSAYSTMHSPQHNGNCVVANAATGRKSPLETGNNKGCVSLGEDLESQLIYRQFSINNSVDSEHSYAAVTAASAPLSKAIPTSAVIKSTANISATAPSQIGNQVDKTENASISQVNVNAHPGHISLKKKRSSSGGALHPGIGHKEVDSSNTLMQPIQRTVPF